MKSLIALSPWSSRMIYGENQIRRIKSTTNLILEAPLSTEAFLERKDLLAEVELLFSGWGGPVLDREFLEAAPNLKMYLYAGGSCSGIVTPEWAASTVVLSTTVEYNSESVAEYTLGFILISLKRALPLANWIRKNRTYPEIDDKCSPGNFESTVGLVALGYAGRQMIKKLSHHDHRVIAYDPYIDEAWAGKHNVEMVDLDTLFATADVVSIHLPTNKETRGMIEGRHIRLMKPNSTFINTSRGKVLNEEDVLSALEERSDVQAIFDVAIKEPPPSDSRFYELPNLVLTPHIAGSLFKECERMGNAMIDECVRFQQGQPLRHEIRRMEASVH